MLRRQFIKKLTITSAICFSVFLMCLIPNKKESIKITQKLEYIDDDLNKEVIYLLDKNDYLGKTEVVINSKDIEIKAKELLNILIKDSSSENKIPSGFKGIIPVDTEIISIEYKDNLIKVNFNNKLLDVEEKYEEKIIEAIVYTLTSIKEIKQVIIYIDGNIITKLPKSKKYLPSTLDRSYGINKEYNISDYNNVSTVTMYYLNKYNDDYYYVPVTKYLNDNREKLEIIVDELSNSNTNLVSFLNSNVVLLDKKIEDNKAILTFNEYIFSDVVNHLIDDKVIEELELSIKDNYNVDEVSLKYNNEEISKTSKKTIE